VEMSYTQLMSLHRGLFYCTAGLVLNKPYDLPVVSKRDPYLLFLAMMASATLFGTSA
jgi:hypothetical protein